MLDGRQPIQLVARTTLPEQVARKVKAAVEFPLDDDTQCFVSSESSTRVISCSAMVGIEIRRAPL
jgi:hypothetical protein